MGYVDNGIERETRHIIYVTLELDPKYIPSREEMLTRLDAELEAMRRDVITAWDGMTEHAS